MGFASTALDGDTGLMFYNPAGLADDPTAQFSASLTSYTRVDTRTGRYVSLFKSAADNVSRGGYLVVPSMVGGHLRSKDLVWGGAIFVPNSFENSGNVEFGSSNLASFQSRADQTWIGVFGATRWAGVPVGVSVFYVSQSLFESFAFLYRGALSRIEFQDRKFNANGLSVLLGAQKEFSQNWRWGLSLRLPVWHLGGSASANNVDSGSASSTESSELKSLRVPVPLRLSAGLSYRPRPTMTWALDLHYYGDVLGRIASGSDPYFDIRAYGIPNINLGFDSKLTESTGIRLGWFTNLSAALELPKVISGIHDKVHMFGGTLALYFEKTTGTISIGGYAMGGQGSSTAVNPDSKGLTPRSNYIYGFMVGSSFKF